MPPPPSQPVPTTRSAAAKAQATNLALPSSSKQGASPASYGAMTGISFTNGGGFSLENRPRSFKWGGGAVGSFGSRFYGDAGDSPTVFSTSITMEPSSFAASAATFGLPPPYLSSSYQRRSYAAAVAHGRDSHPNNLSTSLASMSMSYQPMSIGSYSRSQVSNLMAVTRTDAELTKAYECCGHVHEGLHALLEHVEDAHPLSDPDNPGDQGFSPATHAMEFEMDGLNECLAKQASAVESSTSGRSPTTIPSYPLPPSGCSSKASTPNENPQSITSLQISDLLTSPPDIDPSLSTAMITRTTSTCSSPPDGSLATPSTSTWPSPVFTAPKVGPARSGFLTTTAPRPKVQQKYFDRAFNEVVAGESKESLLDAEKIPGPSAVAPGVLFASAVASFGIPTITPGTRRPEDGDAEAPASKAVNEPILPQPSALSTNRPWRCPNPGCNKAYRQSNGLKYHQQKGQCDYAMHDAIDLGLSVAEAEERNRPFVCAVGAGCFKRYRQMNGLKYHYLNSGEHGQYGLRMIQNGSHPHPPTLPQPAKRPIHTSLASTHPRPAGTPYVVPNKSASTHTSTAPRLGTWPATSTPIKTPAQSIPTALPPIQKGRDAVLFAAPIGLDLLASQ